MNERVLSCRDARHNLDSLRESSTDLSPEELREEPSSRAAIRLVGYGISPIRPQIRHDCPVRIEDVELVEAFRLDHLSEYHIIP